MHLFEENLCSWIKIDFGSGEGQNRSGNFYLMSDQEKKQICNTQNQKLINKNSLLFEFVHFKN